MIKTTRWDRFYSVVELLAAAWRGGGGGGGVLHLGHASEIYFHLERNCIQYFSELKTQSLPDSLFCRVSLLSSQMSRTCLNNHA